MNEPKKTIQVGCGGCAKARNAVGKVPVIGDMIRKRLEEVNKRIQERKANAAGTPPK